MSTLLFIHAFILQYIFVTCSVPITMLDAEDKRLAVIPWFINQLLLLLLSRFSRIRLCATPQTAAHQAPLSLIYFLGDQCCESMWKREL